MPHIPDHLTHDPELVAAYAAGDATGPDLAAATELVAACTECAELHRDLRAIATALPELPVPARTRDFRLTPEQAASLAPSGWRGVLAAFASPRFRLAAPLGTGLAAAGLAGLLLATPGGLDPRLLGRLERRDHGRAVGEGHRTARGLGCRVLCPGCVSRRRVSAPRGDGIRRGLGSRGRRTGRRTGWRRSRDPGRRPRRGREPGRWWRCRGCAAGLEPRSRAGRAGIVPATVATDAAGGVQPAGASTGATPWLVVSAVLLLAGVVLLVLRLAARSIVAPLIAAPGTLPGQRPSGQGHAAHPRPPRPTTRSSSPPTPRATRPGPTSPPRPSSSPRAPSAPSSTATCVPSRPPCPSCPSPRGRATSGSRPSRRPRSPRRAGAASSRPSPRPGSGSPRRWAPGSPPRASRACSWPPRAV